jgi:glycosyltransferase involved in cell wall biosynthesis
MRILYIADGRSPIALSWIGYFIRTGHEIHLATTYPCQPISGLASMVVIPVAMSGSYGQPEGGRSNQDRMLRKLLPVSLRTKIRQLAAPLTFPRASNIFGEVIEKIRPDLIHAMRIPFEGMIASMTVKRGAKPGEKTGKIPLLISIWGNDFTLHARSTPVMAHYTRQSLEYCDALHTDCRRDLRIAQELGFASTKPCIVLPGGGGIKLDVFYPPKGNIDENRTPSMVEKAPMTIINPRGFRAYVRNDTFFHAIPLVLKERRNVRFVCPGMAGEAQAQNWITDLGIDEKVELLPPQSPQGMAELFRQSQISLSITTHDGTPNTLLEAMACGCFPIAGDIESLREWITPGVNGLLVDSGEWNALAAAIVNALSQPELRRQAGERNLQMVKERAEYKKIMGEAEEFYGRLIMRKSDLF